MKEKRLLCDDGKLSGGKFNCKEIKKQGRRRKNTDVELWLRISRKFNQFSRVETAIWMKRLQDFVFSLSWFIVPWVSDDFHESSLEQLFFFQDDHKAFRRQLEDKRPIVESNLMSGRQYVSSEPPLSDNSDSEGLLKIRQLFVIFPLIFISTQPAFDVESRYLSAEDQNRELTRSIRREVAKLTEQWNHLINRSDNWKHRLDEFMTVSSDLSYTLCIAKKSRNFRSRQRNYFLRFHFRRTCSNLIRLRKLFNFSFRLLSASPPDKSPTPEPKPRKPLRDTQKATK
jgi:hypothetical protein